MVTGTGLNLEAVRARLWETILTEATGAGLDQLREPGWELLGGSGVDASETGLDRATINREARRLYFTDPSVRWMVQLHSAFTFGRGVSLRGRDPEVNDWIGQFWSHGRNRAALSRVRQQWNMSRDLMLNGEVFLAFYTSTITGRVTVRRIPPDQIVRVVAQDGDAAMPLYFERQYTGTDGKYYRQLLPDYRVADLKNAGRALMGAEYTEIAMMHILADEHDGRGISALAASIPWARALKGFMEDRATLTLALATFAFKAKVHGNQQAAQRVRDQLGGYEMAERYGGYGPDTRERRQGANTWIENDAMDLEQMRTDSGAANAYQDMRMLRQQAGIGAGLFEHYMGDPSTGNLATATAMELPMLKMFEFGQEDWGEVFEEVGDFVVRQGLRFGALRNGTYDVDMSGGVPMWTTAPRTDDDDISVEASFPPVVQRDIAVWANALATIKNAESAGGDRLVPAEESAEVALRLLGYSDTGPILERMREMGFARASGDTPPSDPPPNSGGEDNTRENAGYGGQMAESDGEDNARDVGEELPSGDARKERTIRQRDMRDGFKRWADMPSLDELAEELGVSVEDVRAGNA